MAVVASIAVVLIAPHVIMFIVHVATAVAREAGEDREVPWIGMAFRAGGPLIAVLAREDGKVLTIVLRKIRAIPGSGVVTDLAVPRKSR